MLHPVKGTNTVRAVLVVDPTGTLRLHLVYPQEIGRNIDEVVRAVRALTTADENKVAMPADRPHNDLIDGRVIIPPPQTQEEAETRLSKYEGYDWWFCHKELRRRTCRSRLCVAVENCIGIGGSYGQQNRSG